MENVASQDLKAALLESAQIEARKKQAWQEQVDLLSQSLASFEQGAQLDCSTPADGHCLFHALAQGGLVEGIPGSLTVEQLRALAISSATPEQLQHAALSTAGTSGAGMTVDEYVKGMLGGLYGDNLVVALLAVEFQRNIVVINKDSARSFLLAGGEQQGLVPDAIWVAHLSEQHYFGVIRGAVVGAERASEASGEPLSSSQSTRGMLLVASGRGLPACLPACLLACLPAFCLLPA